MADLFIGQSASDRTGTRDATYTNIMNTTPADGTGTITTIEVWANATVANLNVATFFVVSGNNLSTRDSCIIGTVASGSKQTFTLDASSNPISLDVVEGDFIGAWWSGGKIDADSDAGTGFWYLSGKYIPCTNQTFTYTTFSIDQLSIHGTGATEGAAAADNAIFFGMNF